MGGLVAVQARCWGYYVPEDLFCQSEEATQGGLPQPHGAPWGAIGPDGAIGLHLAFTGDEGRCVVRFRPKPEHQGYPGRLHGGLIRTLLDELTQIPAYSGIELCTTGDRCPLPQRHGTETGFDGRQGSCYSINEQMNS